MPVRVAMMAFMLCVLVPTSASAHAVLLRSDPADTSTQKEVPETIQMEFTENVDVFSAEVTDGCGRDVLQATEFDGVDIRLDLGSAQPGRFKVVYELVSGDDGHRSDGRIAFRVKGTKDCSTEEPEEDGTTQASGAEDQGSPPWMLLGGVAVAFVLGAAAIRHRSSTRS